MKLMKLDNVIILYIKKENLLDYNLTSKDLIEDYFKNLFVILKDDYDININGFYNIDVYNDIYYGSIIILKKEDIDYYGYYDNTIDMQIIIHNDSFFLYEINNINFIDKSLLSKVIVYKYKNKLFFKLNNPINPIWLGKLIESTNIIYGDKVTNIIKKSRPIDIKLIDC